MKTKPRSFVIFSIGVLLVSGVVIIAPPLTNASGADDRKVRIDEMAQLVRPMRLARPDNGTPIAVDRLREPLLRWSDPTRESSDGSLWAFGTSGRPAAAVAVELYPDPKYGQVWAYEFVSLSTGPVELTGGTGFDIAWEDLPPPQADGAISWHPAKPGVTFQEIPDSPAPADSESKRLRQIKSLAERFSATEYYDKTKQNYPLRHSTHPIHRYHDSREQIIDGAMFVFLHGTNPEVILLVEAQGKSQTGVTWRWAAAVLTRADPTVCLDQKSVWTRPHSLVFGPTDTYFSARKVRAQQSGEIPNSAKEK